MRIVYIGPVAPLSGGIAHCGSGLVRGLRNSGHEVEVVSWAAQWPARLYKSPPRDVTVVPLEGTDFSMRWWEPWSWWRAGRAARSADLVVLPWVVPLQAPSYRTILAGAAHVPTLMVVHNPRPHEPRPMDMALTRSVLRRADALLTHSEAALRTLTEIVPDKPAAFSPHPPNIALAAHPLPPRPPIKALFFGIVRPYKGLDLAFDAIVALRARGVPVELTVAGEFWDPIENWRDRVAAAGLADAVELRPGYVADHAVEGLFASHHLVIASYRSATQSGVVPLALAAGRPTVATPVGGLAEQVVDGETGVVSERADAPSFAEAIERAIAQLDTLAAGARAHAASWDTAAKAAVALIEGLPGRDAR
jgi:glycosyltransferase involved in cell wall biosynthesis